MPGSAAPGCGGPSWTGRSRPRQHGRCPVPRRRCRRACLRTRAAGRAAPRHECRVATIRGAVPERAHPCSEIRNSKDSSSIGTMALNGRGIFGLPRCRTRPCRIQQGDPAVQAWHEALTRTGACSSPVPRVGPCVRPACKQSPSLPPPVAAPHAHPAPSVGRGGAGLKGDLDAAPAVRQVLHHEPPMAIVRRRLAAQEDRVVQRVPRDDGIDPALRNEVEEAPLVLLPRRDAPLAVVEQGTHGLPVGTLQRPGSRSPQLREARQGCEASASLNAPGIARHGPWITS